LGKSYCLPLLICGIIDLMEEKTLENNSAAVKDKYREPINEESVDSEEKASSEKETPLAKEKSLESIEKPIEEKKEAAVEKGTEEKSDKEKPVAEVSQPVEGGNVEKVKPTVAPPSAQARKKAKQLQDLDRPNQIKALSDLAFEKGLNFAVEVAKALDSAYVLDELHDALVDELYQKLLEQGKLNKL
jgi:hypothetical protein